VDLYDDDADDDDDDDDDGCVKLFALRRGRVLSSETPPE